jgi:type VII secretion protein EccB
VPSRQDQLHSYQYSVQRVVSALVTHDPDPHRSPLRRAGTTALVSLVTAALAVGGVAVYGLLTGAAAGTPDSDTVVYVEKGSGARYVLDKDEGRLHPMLNFSSALLAGKGQAPDVEEMSHDQLAKVPLGEPLGIPGAPDSLPGPGDLLPGVWTVCSQAADNAAPGAGPEGLLAVGAAITDGAVLPVPGPGTPAQDLRALLVEDATGRTFMVYGNRRFLIPRARVRQIAVGFGWARQPVHVATAWINAIPAAPDLKPPAIPGRGDPSARIPGREVGRLLRVTDNPAATDQQVQWGVVMGDGIADVTYVQALLMRTDAEGGDPETVTVARYAALPPSTTVLTTAAASAGYPATVPALLGDARRLCLTYSAEDGGMSIRVDPTAPAGVAVSGTPVPGAVQADLVHVPRGKGAVVVAAASPSAPASAATVTVVADTGRRYAVASRAALAKLGYGGVVMPRIPAGLVALLPQGPALDPTRARQPPAGGR